MVVADRSFGEAFKVDARIQPRNGREASLTPADSLAVALGLRDGLSSLYSDLWLARLARALFGLGPRRPLADPRLESLRRLAVRLRHEPAKASLEIASALASGVTADQVADIQQRVRAVVSR